MRTIPFWGRGSKILIILAFDPAVVELTPAISSSPEKPFKIPMRSEYIEGPAIQSFKDLAHQTVKILHFFDFLQTLTIRWIADQTAVFPFGTQISHIHLLKRDMVADSSQFGMVASNAHHFVIYISSPDI